MTASKMAFCGLLLHVEHVSRFFMWCSTHVLAVNDRIGSGVEGVAVNSRGE